MNFIYRTKFYLILVIFTLSLQSSCKSIYALSNRYTDITISSASSGQDSVAKTLDGNPDTSWNSGKAAPQWIELKLASPRTINKIRLQVSQWPKGRTKLVITAGAASNPTNAVYNLDKVTEDKEWLTIPFLSPVSNAQYVRLTVTASPSWISWREIEIYEGNSPEKAQFTSLSYHDRYDTIPNTIDYTNTVNVGAWSLTDTVEQLAQKDVNSLDDQTAKGKKIILSFGNVLFRAHATEPWYLYPDATDRFTRYWNIVGPHTKNVIAFYPLDEPDLRLSGRMEQYENAIKIIKSKTNLPVLTLFSNLGVLKIMQGNMTVPAGTDIMAYDEYFCWDNCNGASAPEKFAAIAERMKQAGKSVWIILDGVKSGTVPPTEQEQQAWVTRDKSWMSLCLATSNCTGGMIFLWRTMVTPWEELVGVSSMPILNSYLRSVGLPIKSSLDPISPPFLPGDLNFSHKVDIFDYNMFLLDFGKTGSPGFAPADINKNGAVEIFDYNTLVVNFGKNI